MCVVCSVWMGAQRRTMDWQQWEVINRFVCVVIEHVNKQFFGWDESEQQRKRMFFLFDLFCFVFLCSSFGFAAIDFCSLLAALPPLKTLTATSSLIFFFVSSKVNIYALNSHLLVLHIDFDCLHSIRQRARIWIENNNKIADFAYFIWSFSPHSHSLSCTLKTINKHWVQVWLQYAQVALYTHLSLHTARASASARQHILY